MASPKETNAAVEAVVLSCRRDFTIAVLTPNGRLRPKRERREEEALFDVIFGRAEAVVDGAAHDIGVGGAGGEATVTLFAREADALLAALHDGRTLTLRFDILPETAKDGGGLETVASFDLAGLSSAMAAAGPACRDPAPGPPSP
ncbi:hypothetical protein [Acuticoccus sp.]|uniref:hypothetical protein n=1 Tax=Acuticoccus sp. TaxID=1904378 RepID=UPI003B51FA12